MPEASISTHLSFYIAGFITLLVWMTLHDINHLRATLIVLLLWPLVPLIVLIAWRRGWYVDIKHQPDLSPFGFRTRADSGTGWAIRCLWLELQVWKSKREPKQ